jgi:hypothetical protein
VFLTTKQKYILKMFKKLLNEKQNQKSLGLAGCANFGCMYQTAVSWNCNQATELPSLYHLLLFSTA